MHEERASVHSNTCLIDHAEVGEQGPNKRKRSSIAEYGRKVGRKVSAFCRRDKRERNDSGYQSLIPSSTPEAEQTRPTEAEIEEQHRDVPTARDLMSITTAADEEGDATPLMLSRGRSSTKRSWPTSLPSQSSESSVRASPQMAQPSARFGLGNSRFVAFVQNDGYAEHIEDAEAYHSALASVNHSRSSSSPVRAEQEMTPPGQLPSAREQAGDFDVDEFHRVLRAKDRKDEFDEVARDDYFNTRKGNQTSQQAQVNAAKSYREKFVPDRKKARPSLCRVQARDQPGPSTEVSNSRFDLDSDDLGLTLF